MDPFWTNDDTTPRCDTCGLQFCDGHQTIWQQHSRKVLLAVAFFVVALLAGGLGVLIGQRDKETVSNPSSSTIQQNSTNPSTSTSVASTTAGTVPVTEDQALMLSTVNQERTFRGLNPLTWCPALERSSTAHSRDMAARDYFEHASPEGEEVWNRAKAQGYDYTTVGENIAVGQRTVEEVMIGWMDSKGHRENILNPAYTHLGYGKATGTYEGDAGYIYWTQNFGAGGDCN